MTIRPILIHPESKLRKKALPITVVSDQMLRLADDMVETMYEAPGIGLAAPQVGALVRVIVLDCKGEDQNSDAIQMFNPKILFASYEKNTHEEGCLSIPDQYGEVERPSVVTVGWIDRTGVEEQRTFNGLWATCVQHEIDHLNGKLFIDYLTPLRRQLITRKMKKLKREKLQG